MVAFISARIFGKSSGSLVQRTPSMVSRRPLTTTSLFATSTKRLTRWKKSARLKKLPVNSSSRGTVSSPAGAAGAVPVVPAPHFRRHGRPSRRWRSGCRPRPARWPSGRCCWPLPRRRPVRSGPARRRPRPGVAGSAGAVVPGGVALVPVGRRGGRVHALAGLDLGEVDARAGRRGVELNDQARHVDRRRDRLAQAHDLRVVGREVLLGFLAASSCCCAVSRRSSCWSPPPRRPSTPPCAAATSSRNQ